MPALLVAGYAVVGAQSSHAAGPIEMKPGFAPVHAIIQKNCLVCRNNKSHPEKVNLTSLTTLMHSGEHGPIVIAGNPEKSNLLRYIDGEKKPRMPYKRTPLSKADIAIVKAWIKYGARP